MTDEKDKKDTKKESGKKGGLARAATMAPTAKREGARKAAAARWAGHVKGAQKATHSGVVKIGDLELPCAVLQDGTRVFSERGLAEALGRWRSGSHFKKKLQASEEDRLPVVLSGPVAEYIDAPTLAALRHPKPYTHQGGFPAHGYDAELLPGICEAWLAARDAGVLSETEARVAQKAYVLTRGFARVAVTALIDEATGYQRVRERDELHRILERYVQKELLPWAKRFPDSFYDEMFRLRGWTRNANKMPPFAGKLVNETVYRRMPPGVLVELRKANPTDERGRRKARHHQHLTDDVGHPHLRDLLIQVTALMRAADTWQGFMRMLNRSCPVPQGAVQLELPGAEDDYA